MSARWQTAALALAVTFGAGCRPPPSPEPIEAPASTAGADAAAILTLSGSYIAAFNAGDADALAELFTLHAIRMPPMQPAYSGRSRIEADFARAFAMREGQITLTVEETDIHGDLAYARGTYATTTRLRGGGGERQEVGKWVNLVEREPGEPWKISAQIWNTDHPVPSSDT